MNINKSLFKFCIFSIFFSLTLGTLLHFLYEWSGKNFIIGAFSAINESTWEHLKLVFYPMLITSIIGYFLFSNKYKNFVCSRVLGIIISISFIVIFFYTYTGIIGNNYAFLDITSFIIAVFISEIISFKNIISNRKCNNLSSLLYICILFLFFIVFTYFPPRINLFKNPINNSYGIYK